MIVHDFDAVRAIHFPHEANTPLVIDANAVLALAIAFQRLELITWRNAQTGEFGCCMQLQQLAPGHTFDVPETSHGLSVEQRLGVVTRKRANHERY